MPLDEPLAIVELGMDYCSLTYGMNPCTAVLGDVFTPGTPGTPAVPGGTLTKSVDRPATSSFGVDRNYNATITRLGPTSWRVDVEVIAGSSNAPTESVHYFQLWEYDRVRADAVNWGDLILEHEIGDIPSSGDNIEFSLEFEFDPSPEANVPPYPYPIQLRTTHNWRRHSDSSSTRRQRYAVINWPDAELNALAEGVAGTPGTPATTSSNPRKCFNTFATCQDEDNYARGSLITRLGYARGGYPKASPAAGETPIFACLRSISSVPTALNPGTVSDRRYKALGRRASVRIVAEDFAYHDRAFDKYHAERLSGAAQADMTGYDPFDRGTFWGRWRARNPFYTGRPITIREGFADQPLAEWSSRRYFIDRIEGPHEDGTISITAKDPLKLVEDDRAVAPRPSSGVLGVFLDVEQDKRDTLRDLGRYSDGLRTDVESFNIQLESLRRQVAILQEEIARCDEDEALQAEIDAAESAISGLSSRVSGLENAP